MEYPDEIPNFRPTDAASVRRIVREELRAWGRALSPTVEPTSPVFDAVIADLRARDRKGFERFGRPMVAGDRDALREAYDEALDLVVYLREELDIREQEDGS